jgi:hypothetical protein
MTKAFDHVNHSLLFEKLFNRGMPSIFIRFLIATYRKQTANVKWNGELSNEFHLCNGVKQGAVLSAILYCVYVDDLFLRLRHKRVGCWINGEYLGIAGYADDNFLISPTLEGLQEMLNTCDEYAKEHHLNFSTNKDPKKSKTKCMAFLQKDRKLKNMKLAGNNLPWVESGKHLGVKIENSIDGLKQDMMEKRGQFINTNNTLMQEFYFAHPDTKVTLNSIYNSHFTGAPLWDLFCREATMIENSWNVAIRKMLNIDFQTHRYLIEPLSCRRHIKFSLLKRFLTFIEKIKDSKKTPITTLLTSIKQDVRSTTGKNLRNIMLAVGKLTYLLTLTNLFGSSR